MKNVIYLLALLCVLFSSCEKLSVPQDNNTNKTCTAYVNITNVQQEMFTRSAISLPFTRISYGLFDSNGDKLYGKNQTENDDSYGSVSFALDPGEYTLITIGHSGLGNATITSPEKVTFYNSKVTDTFYSYNKFTINDSSLIIPVTLNRAAGMIRIVNTGVNLSDNYKFYYTGGSSTFNPYFGYGCINSRQTEYRDSTKIYEIYTFPHEENDLVKLVISKKADDGSYIEQKTITDIPVGKNKITTLTGDLSSNVQGSGSSGIDISIIINSTWSGETNLNY